VVNRIEDTANTGLTLDYVLRRLRARHPAGLEVCVRFDKRGRRLVDVPVRCELKPAAYARNTQDR